jgi:hypothetical protein
VHGSDVSFETTAQSSSTWLTTQQCSIYQPATQYNNCYVLRLDR